MTDTNWYTDHPLTTRDRRRSTSPHLWTSGFGCEDVRPLIVCRGPIRKEAMDVFEQMGITHYGMLLSEKDSIVYTQSLAPELRRMRPEHVHRVHDYTGANGEERVQRMQEIVAIAKTHGYTHVFAGYGFMAEDEQFVRTIEEAGLGFIGPRASVQRAAGRKDEAKRTALSENVSITPGIDDVTSRVLRRKHADHAALRAAVDAYDLTVEPSRLHDSTPLAAAAEAVLEASYARGVDLYTIDELSAEVERCAAQLFIDQPGHRIRLKAIGGGGGKGQRILSGIPRGGSAADAAAAAAQAPGLVREILAEVKATGVGDNKNILLELNIEETRHNEIQLIGNGTWCIAMGGRDCSLQMHEQKLLEVSVTEERLAEAAARARRAGRTTEATALEYDLETLRRMEAEAERFGVAVGLDSASTFECIVSGEHHYFMEMNTRIQVEHRVSELCYALRFRNPSDASEFFDVTSLVEAMVLIARHGGRLPRPFRIPREGAAVEARLNATDSSLSPHAFGTIISWSNPLECEIRDDQGICTTNPDTGLFVHYRLAGAYDSNIALLVTYADERQESYERLGEILRVAKLRGFDLHTNLEFHYGLVHWFLARGVWAKPTTRFVVPYLTQVGLLHEATAALDLVYAWTKIGAAREAALRAVGDGEITQKAIAATRRALQLKETLFKRPLDAIFDEAHIFSAWLSRNIHSFTIEHGRVVWQRNPLEVLADTYWILNMDYRSGVPAAHIIWDHDNELLQTGLTFYRTLETRLAGAERHIPWPELSARLANAEPPAGFDASTWAEVRASHAGFQCGLELLDLLPLIGDRTGFFDLKVEADLSITIPARLTEPALQARMKKVLAPPPATKANEIVAVSGGMFYAQEAPHLPPFVTVGSHFDAGQPIYIIEVMKMFNKVYAPFAGTIDKVLIEGGEGTIVQKGQPLFAVTPDEKIVDESAADRQKRLRSATDTYLGSILR